MLQFYGILCPFPQRSLPTLRCPQRPTVIGKGRNLLKSIQLFIDVFFLEKVEVVRNVKADWDLLAIQHSQFSQRKYLGNVTSDAIKIKPHFKLTISGPFLVFCRLYIYIFHKNSVQMVIFWCLTYQQPNWIKSYNIKYYKNNFPYFAVL